jgi:prepilin-type N-terminal cleavage/methylation domain-containing protein
MSQPKRQQGFTLIEIMITVVLIGLLAAIAIPNFIRSRTTAQANVCINNLRAIDYAIQQWALEQRKAANAAVQFTDISSYLKNSVTCPAGGGSFEDSYLITAVGEEPICQRVPGAHLILQLIASSGTGSPTSQGSGSPVGGPSSGNNGNNGNGNNGNGNGLGNGGIGNGNGNGNTP